MQFLTLLTTAVIAASSAYGKYGQQGWQVCDTSALWVYGGDCPPHTACYFNERNQSPYCI
ncbi:hypothetical protein VdG2_00679 [Verticillium dahliae VDG2]|nr:hypothetical protein VdG2_00679 [Verticillium dahliae VDG2]